jgi:uncharacterized alkaline shock family protein YloU
MKIIEKITLALYSIIMLVISIITCLLMAGWLNIDIINALVVKALSVESVYNLILIINIIFILLSVICIFFSSSDKEEGSKNGILLENENGKLLITQETLESLVNSVVRGFLSVESNTTKVYLDKDNNVKVLVSLTVTSNAVIKDLSAALQAKIKEAIKTSSDLEVKEVDIKVKNIANKPKIKD